jgi:hypothetical protein
MLDVSLALSNDEHSRKLADQHAWVELEEHNERVRKSTEELQRRQPVTEAAGLLRVAEQQRDVAYKSGDPAAIKAADDAVNQAAAHLQQESQRLDMIERSIKGTSYTGKQLTPRQLAMQRFIEENPHATAEQLREFDLRFKEDAPDVAARKDRELERKERLDKMNADHRNRMADIAEDRNISTAERDRRLAEERERHDRATEQLGERRADIAEAAISSRERIAADKWRAQQLAQEGSQKAERKARFDELKAAMPPDTPASKVWDAVDQQMMEAKAPHISEFGLRSAAERFIAGDKTALQGFGRNPVLFGKIESEIAKVAQEKGLSGTDLTRIQQDFAAATKAVKDFATGKQGQTAQSLNVATQHLALLSEAARALAQNDSRTLNRIQNAFKNEFGWDEPITFNAIKTIVGSEVEKAVAGSAGALEDRRELRDGLSAQSTPEQLTSVIEGYKGLMAGQLQGLEKTYERTTRRTDFRDEFLLPEARKEMDRIAPRAGQGASQGPRDGETSTSKSGKPIVYRNGNWEYQ